MQGPFARGILVSPGPPSDYCWETNRLVRGASYRVIRRFTDADGDEHLPGEEWRFNSTMFNRQIDELNLRISFASDDEWIIPLFWTPEGQEEIVDNFRQYVAPIQPQRVP